MSKGEQMKTFSEILKEKLAERGWSRYKLAKEAGVHVSSVSSYIDRGCFPNLYTAYDIAIALGCGIEEFLCLPRKNITIKLPCNVGDTIFVIRNDIIEQENVRGIKIGNCGLLLQVSKGVDDFEYHYEIEIGNKLFFAKEEAEAKMKGGAE